MQVLKRFVANGVAYKPGDKAPEVDSATAAHYVRYGMIGEPAKPAETKPEGKKPAKPAETKPAAPEESK